MPKSSKPPSYRLHKASGQAVVTINRKDIYLGVYGSAESRQLYSQLLAGIVRPEQVVRRPTSLVSVTCNRTMVELLAAFWKHAKTYYVDREGKPSREQLNFRTLIRRLREFAGRMLIEEFGPNRLREFRETLIETGMARSTINQRVNFVRRIFKWGVGCELVPTAVHQALSAVEPLRFGKTKARETTPVTTVDSADVEETLHYCSPPIAAMIRLQIFTGMRSGEVCIMRTCDIDTSSEVWSYRPHYHKTAYRGHERVIFLGPEAQAILRPWLRTNPNDYLFQPAESVKWRRKYPLDGKQTLDSRLNVTKKKPHRKYYRAHYTPMSYRQAINYALAKCNKNRKHQGKPPFHWHPHQLRHNAATKLARELGLETARVVLGHRSAAITQVYAEIDMNRAVDAMAKLG